MRKRVDDIQNETCHGGGVTPIGILHTVRSGISFFAYPSEKHIHVQYVHVYSPERSERRVSPFQCLWRQVGIECLAQGILADTGIKLDQTPDLLIIGWFLTTRPPWHAQKNTVVVFNRIIQVDI